MLKKKHKQCLSCHGLSLAQMMFSSIVTAVHLRQSHRTCILVFFLTPSSVGATTLITFYGKCPGRYWRDSANRISVRFDGFGRWLGSRSKIESKNAAERFGRPGHEPNRIFDSVWPRADRKTCPLTHSTEVRSLLCQVFDSFSLVTSSSSHLASHLRVFIQSLTRPNWSFPSTRLTMIFFLLRQEIFGRYMAIITVNEWASVGPGITSDRGFGRRSPPDLHSLTKNTSLEHKDRDFLQLNTRAAALGIQSYGRSYFCLLNVIFGCVSTEISIQISTRSFPNPMEYSVC